MFHVILLRGINLGPKNRIPMPALRDALTDAGFNHARTYVQSGNVVLKADEPAGELAERVRTLITERFGLDVAVVARTRDELAEVVERNPIPEATGDPKRYQVSFLSAELDPPTLKRLERLAEENPNERLVASGREIYTWHREGVARSKLWNRLAGKGGLGGVVATARNWTTVTTLLEMCADETP